MYFGRLVELADTETLFSRVLHPILTPCSLLSRIRIRIHRNDGFYWGEVYPAFLIRPPGVFFTIAVLLRNRSALRKNRRLLIWGIVILLLAILPVSSTLKLIFRHDRKQKAWER